MAAVATPKPDTITSNGVIVTADCATCGLRLCLDNATNTWRHWTTNRPSCPTGTPAT
jgi:hypothetical protein